jgi:hypothetical protein
MLVVLVSLIVVEVLVELVKLVKLIRVVLLNLPYWFHFAPASSPAPVRAVTDSVNTV